MAGSQSSLYEVLLVDPDVSSDELKVAYKRIIIKLHPDKAGDGYDKERLMQVQLAWNTLNDPKKRAEYDQRLQEQSSALQTCNYNEATLDEFEMTEDEVVHFSLECRCGGHFSLTKTDLDLGFNLIPCTNCSAMTLIVK